MFSPELISQIVFGLLAGIIAGIITGLTPGLHINTLAFFIVSSLAFLTKYFQPLPLASFITSMSITHTFFNFIPGVFLGSPDEDTSLSVLPGQAMLLEGRGHHAVLYTLYGGLFGLVILLIFVPVFIYLLPKAYPYIKQLMFFILFFASAYMLWREEKKLLACLVFVLSGFLGLATFSLLLKESLLPMLTGLFGASSLILSLKNKQNIPKQKSSKFKFGMKKKQILKIMGSSALASSFCSFLPALGSGQAAVMASDINGENNKSEFLVLLGSINTIVMALSIVSLYSLDVKRTGSAAALSEILGNFSMTYLFILVGVMIISGVLSFFLAKKVSLSFSKSINKINYKTLSICILIFIAILVILFSGLYGLLVFFTSTLLGIFTISSNARRTLMMGCLMLPALLWYFPL